MKNHRITAATWKLEAAQQGRLRRVIVPLDIKEEGNTWVYSSEPIDLFWFKGDEIGERLYKALPYQIGDRLYLAEEWCKGDWGGAFDDDIYFTRSTTPEAEHIGWQPAHTMPEAAATHWYKVTGVRVVQCGGIGVHTAIFAGLAPNILDGSDGAGERFWDMTKQSWNATHPDCHWDAERWVVVLEIKEVEK